MTLVSKSQIAFLEIIDKELEIGHQGINLEARP